MKKYSRIIQLLVIPFLFTVATVYAVTYPSGTPSGEQSGGWFNTYFTNMFGTVGINDVSPSYAVGCGVGQVIRGFTSTGMLLCITPTSVSCLPGGTGVGNTCYGIGSLTANTTGGSNQANGQYTLASNLQGTGNTANGAYSLFSNQYNSFNTAVGYRSAYTTQGTGNTAVGAQTLYLNNWGDNNTILGYLAGYSTTGDDNTAIGTNSLFLNTSGSRNIAIGYAAGYGIQNSTDTIAIGVNSLYSNTSGNNNIAIGKDVAALKSAGSRNIIIGNNALPNNTSGGDYNTIVGDSTAQGINIGSYNTILGANISGLNNWLSNNIIIADGQGNQRINVDATGNVGLGTITPGAKLEVAGQVKITGGSPGAGKTLVSDSTGLATWTDTVSGSTATGIIGGVGVAHYIPKFGTGGNGIYSSQLYENAGNIGLGTTTPGAKLDVVGQIRITGGSPGLGKVLSSDASGLATWISTVSGSTATGIIGGAGVSNYLSKFGSGGTGIYPSLLYENGSNVGIGTITPGATLEVAGQIKITGGSPGVGKVLSSDATGLATWVNPSAVAGAWLTNGNSGTVAGTNFIGTLDNQALVFKTNNAENMRILTSGNVGIGTAIPGARLEVAGQIKITGGSPGAGKTLVSDSTGLATWTDTVSGSTATGIIGGSGVANYIPKFGTGGNGIYSSQFYENAGNIGLGTTTPGAKLDVVGQIRITGGSPGIGKVLSSDASGLATWVSTVSGSTATGIIGGTGSANYLSKFGTGGIGIYVSQLFDNGSNVGIGTTSPTAKLTLDSGVNNTAGLRFTRISSSSTTYTGAATGLGVDGSGNLVPISNGDVVVYTAEGGHPKTTTPDPDIPNRLISYDFNTYFAIPTKQSFVVSDGAGAGYNAPYFKEDGVSGICSGGGSPYDCTVADPVTGLSASPNNSFTMTAKGTTYGYQIALGARGDAPLFARSGKFVGSQTGGLYLADNTTPTPWQKVLTVPANHLEYFYVNIGYNSQLQAIAGGGNIGMGTSFPDRRLVIASSGSSTSNDPQVQVRRGIQGADASLANTYGTPYINIGGLENRVGALQTIGFGYNSLSGTVRYAPAEIGFLTTSTTGNTQGDIVFANRNGTTNVAPTEVMRIASNGSIGIGTTNPSTKLEIDSGIADVSGLRLTRLDNASPLTTSNVSAIGVNASGDVIAISPVSNIAVYEGIARNSVLSPDPDVSNVLIKYNFNNFFAIPGKQSFVVSKGDSASYNGPYFKENGTSAMCSGGGSPYDCAVADPVTGLSASPNNSFTMSAKSDNVGYQIALGARGDAPLFARSGFFTSSSNQTGGLFLADLSTPTPWQKVLSVPANHPEYFYVNSGYNSQLATQSGGGNVGVGTTFPGSRFEIWTGASTAPLMHFRGTNNVALGLDALDVTATGTISSSGNTAIGYNAGSNVTTGSNNIFLGANARAQSATSSNTMNIGNTLFANNLPTSFGGAAGNIGIGVPNPTQQLEISRSINIPATTGANTGVIYNGGTRFLHNYSQSQFPSSNVFLGLNAGNFTMGSAAATLGTQNIGIGSSALSSTSTGYANTAIGNNSMAANTTGIYNMAVGSFALQNNISGNNNSAIGAYALSSNSTGSFNTAIGLNAALNNTIGNGNVAIGTYSLQNNTTGGQHTSIGYYSMYNTTTGNNNVAMGYRSLFANTTGYANTAIGYQALTAANGGVQNTTLGSLAGQSVTTGNNNIAIGYNAGTSITSGANNIVIGAGAQVQSPTGANQLNIGNWIYGSGTLIGIGVTNPTAKLDIAGTIKIADGSQGVGKILTSDANGLATWQTASSGALAGWNLNGNAGTTPATQFIGTSDSKDLVFRTNNIERARFTASGNLAIGTSSGISGLTLSGRLLIGNQLSNPNLANAYIPGVATSISADRSINLIDSAATLKIVRTNGLSYSPAIEIQQWNSALTTNYGYFDIFSENGELAFRDRKGGDTVRMMITSTGQVGIGTTTPGAKLEVAGQVKITGGSPGAGKVLVSDAAGLASWQALAGASGGLTPWSIYGNTGTTSASNFLGTIDAQDLVIKTNNVERVRVLQNGNITLGGAITVGGGNNSMYANTALGNLALANINGMRHTAIGFEALRFATTGGGNTAVGNYAGRNMSWGGGNTIVGSDAATGMSSGGGNLVLGATAGTGITTGSNNIVLGNNASVASGTASNQLSIGNWIYGSGGNIGIGIINPTSKLSISGSLQIIDGNQAVGKILMSDASGVATWTTLSGSLTEWSRGGNSITGSDFIGSTNAQDLVFRTNNIERARILQNGNISINSMILGRGGNGSQVSTTALGVAALLLNTTGISNTAMGNSALASIITGSYNTAMGHGALFNTTGSNNTAIGYNAGTAITTGTNNIAIGYNAAVASATASNQLSIGNWIYGSGGNIGIGTTSPGQKLTLSGGTIQIIDGNQAAGKYLKSDANGVASWQSPNVATGSYIYRMTLSDSTTSSALISISALTSIALPVGPYSFELIGKFQSAATTNGIGMTLVNGTATLNEFVGNMRAQMTTSNMYQGSFVSPGTAVVTTDVPAANTDYALFMNGTFNVTATGTVGIQYRAENNGTTVRLQPGTVLIIRSLNPAIANGGL